MNSKLLRAIVGLAVFALVTPGMVGAATSTAIPITSSTGIPNRVGDNETSLAHDGNLETGTYTTPSSTTDDPAYLAFGFATTPVNRIRLYKNNEYGPHDLIIQYSTDTEPLASRTWITVGGLANGYGGTELLNATSVNTNGTVTADVHVSPPEDGTGWASLRFDTVTATGLRIGFSKTGCCNHYRVFEFEAHHFALTTTIAVGSGQVTPTNTSPVSFDVTFDDPVTGFTADDVILTGTANTGTIDVTDSGDQEHFTVDVPVTSDGTIVASIPAGIAMDASSVGNSASGSASITFDDTDPVLGSVSTSLKGPKVKATFSATDTTAVTFQCKIDSASYTACTSPYSASVPAGPHTFHVLATDAVGNSSTGQSSFTVKSKKIRP